MGNDVNTIILSGRLTKDPELKYTQSGTAIANFTLAVDRGRKSEGGEDLTDFPQCVAFQKTAELLCQFCDKGSPITIVGRLQTRTWDGQDGKKNYSTEVVLNELHFNETKAQADARRGARGSAVPQSREEAQERGVGGGAVGKDEDPFGDQ